MTARRGRRESGDVRARSTTRPDDSIYIVSSNGPYTGNRGGTNWGNSIVRLPPDLRAHKGKPLDAYTPEEYETLDKQLSRLS